MKIFQSYGHKCTATFLWITVYSRNCIWKRSLKVIGNGALWIGRMSLPINGHRVCVLHRLLTLLLTLCGLASQKKPHRRDRAQRISSSRSPSLFPLFCLNTLERIDAGSANCPLIQLIPSINTLLEKKILTAVPCTPKFSKFPRIASIVPLIYGRPME